MAWEEIDVPKGVYIGWGNRTGQHVTGGITGFDPVGATTPAKEGQTVGDACPLLEIVLTEPAASFDRDLNRTDFEAGAEVCLSVSQKQLQRAVAKARLREGDLVRIELKDTARTPNGTVKIFGIAVDRGGYVGAPKTNGASSFAGSSSPSPSMVSVPDDEPPF